MMAAEDQLASHTLGRTGDDHFDPSTLGDCDASIPANPRPNCDPAETRATVNIRFNDICQFGGS